MVMSDFRPEVEIRPFRACTMHPAIIIRTISSLWMWLWGRYHVPQNTCLVLFAIYCVLLTQMNWSSQLNPRCKPRVKADMYKYFFLFYYIFILYIILTELFLTGTEN